ncbi:hypothetical protein C6P75_21630 [Burkholderia multivorans]|nr:hypothetical protein C6P75_21630 [Burkholderia multivorans]
MRMPPMPRRTSGPRIDMSSGIFLPMAGSQFLRPRQAGRRVTASRRLNGRMRPSLSREKPADADAHCAGPATDRP